MNLYTQGAHQAADWLLLKLRSLNGATVALFLRDDGVLLPREARRLPKLPSGQHVGTYRLAAFSYSQAVADMEYLRREHFRPDCVGVGMRQAA